MLAFFTLLTACKEKKIEGGWSEGEKLRVVSTTEMIHAFVKAIGADKIQTQVLIQGQLDPHSYQLVKGDGEKLASCDLIFSNGLGLEHGPSLKQFLEKSEKNIALGDRLYLRKPKEFIHIDQQLDPHIWMDVSLFLHITHEITHALCEKLPEHRELFFKRSQEIRRVCIDFHEQFVRIMQRIPSERRYLVTSHDAFNYFARAYLADAYERSSQQWLDRVNAPEGLAPESQISVGQIAKVADYMEEKGVEVIFTEANVNTDALRKLSSVMQYRKQPITIAKTPLYGDSMPPLPPQTLDVNDLVSRNPYEPEPSFLNYIQMIKHNIDTIYSYLMGELGVEYK